MYIKKEIFSQLFITKKEHVIIFLAFVMIIQTR